MGVYRHLNRLAIGAGIVALLVMAGCAQQPTNPETAEATLAQASSVPPKAEPVIAPVVAEVKPDYATMNPVPIVFDKLSIKLTDADKAVLAQIADRAVKAPKLLITGYCDRNQVGNSKAAAIARASAVKQELVRLGVKPKLVRIKYATTVADKHAAEIAF